jgi:hypothetical protein
VIEGDCLESGDFWGEVAVHKVDDAHASIAHLCLLAFVAVLCGLVFFRGDLFDAFVDLFEFFLHEEVGDNFGDGVGSALAAYSGVVAFSGGAIGHGLIGEAHFV